MRLSLAATALTVLLGGPPAFAATWSAVGPSGGTVRTLASDPRHPQRLYLGTGGGILYRSDDGGLHWRRLTPGFPRRGYSLDQIVIGQGGAVFVGYWEVDGQGGGVARSDDGGEHFTELDGIGRQSVRALAVAPSDSRVIAAGTLSGVFLTRDAGRSWRRITPEGHPDLRNIGSIAFDPTDARTIYAGTWHLGWKTLDGGQSWMPIHRGMIDDSDVMTLTVDHRNPQTLYATACSGIYRSTEGAARWTKLEGIPYASRRTRSFAQSGENANVLLAGTTQGLWISEDRGKAWRRVTGKDLVVNAVLVQPKGTILLGTEDAGVLRSSDRGRTWKPSNQGFSERFVTKVLFDPDRQRVVVATPGDPRVAGVFAAPGVRGPWTHLGGGLEARQVLSLALRGDTILAGTEAGIFMRVRQDDQWNRLPVVLDGTAIRPRVTDLVAQASDRLLAATSKGLLLSTDGGRTWTRPTTGGTGPVQALAASLRNPDRVIAATGRGFFRSDDGGLTWRRSSAGLKGTHGFAFLPKKDRGILAATAAGLFRSDDDGATWRCLSAGIPQSDFTGIAVDPDGRTIMVSDFTSGGVFRSADAGETWHRMAGDGLAWDRVWALSFAPDGDLLAAAAAGGLHVLRSSSAIGADVAP